MKTFVATLLLAVVFAQDAKKEETKKTDVKVSEADAKALLAKTKKCKEASAKADKLCKKTHGEDKADREARCKAIKENKTADLRAKCAAKFKAAKGKCEESYKKAEKTCITKSASALVAGAAAIATMAMLFWSPSDHLLLDLLIV